MRTLKLPGDIKPLEVACGGRTEALLSWLIYRTRGGILDIGCGNGLRLFRMGDMVFRLKRSITAIDWSGEHRINEKQGRRALIASQVGVKIKMQEGVKVINQNPSTVPFSELQPFGIAIVDYDYSRIGLERICRTLIEAAPEPGNPNVIVAWCGYSETRQEEGFNDVWRYVNSLDFDLPNLFHFQGSEIAFTVFNSTPGLMSQLSEITQK